MRRRRDLRAGTRRGWDVPRAWTIGAFLALVAPLPALAWEVHVVGSGPGFVPGDARAVVVAVDGDVIAGGYLGQMVTGPDFVVVRLAAADGAERWRTIVPGPTASVSPSDLTDHVAALALDPAGDVIAVGRTSSLAEPAQFTAVKLDAATGAVRWRYDVADALGAAEAVAVDSAGDAFVAGRAPRFTVVKLAGDTGMPIWTASADGNADAVALLADGDVLVGGNAPGAAVVRLDPLTGAQRWQADLSPDAAGVTLLAVTAGGEIFAGTAQCRDTCNVSDVTVTHVSGATGAQLWQQAVPSTLHTDGLGALAPTPAGDVLAVVNSAVPVGRCLDADRFRAVLLARGDGGIVVDHTLATRSTPSNGEVCVIQGDPIGYGATATASGSIIVVGTTPIAARLEPPDLQEAWRLADARDRAAPGAFVAAAVVAGDRVVVGGRGALAMELGTFGVLSIDADSGHLETCGDGVVDAGERCDDGNVIDGDCCSSDCNLQAAEGTVCDDGNACTVGDVCTSGICRGPTPLPCEPCGTCDPVGGCLGSPVAPCARPTTTDAAMLLVGRTPHGGRRVGWKVGSGPATSVDTLGDPRTAAATSYALCGYAGPQVLLRGTAPGGNCGRNVACWQRTRHGFVYDDPTAPGGLSHVAIRAGGAGHTRLRVVGHGPRLLGPSLPVDSRDIVVQLRRTDDPSTCWMAEHTSLLVNRPRLLRARGD